MIKNIKILPNFWYFNINDYNYNYIINSLNDFFIIIKEKYNNDSNNNDKNIIIN